MLSASKNPVQDFLDQAALQIRRTFFNEAPRAHPVQISGQQDGVITGTIAAVDPENDPIKYRLSKEPVNGEVELRSDGTYTYTPGPDFSGIDGFTVAVTDTGLHINLLNLFRPASTRVTVDVRQGVSNPHGCTTVCVKFTFNYGAGSEMWTPEARDALQATAQLLASHLVVSSPVNLIYDVNAGYLAGALASGSSPTYLTKAFNDNVVQHKIITGVDQNGSTADGHLTFDFSYSWGYGTDVAPYEFSFESAAMHELLHSLGVTTMVGYTTGGYSSFDNFIVSSGGARLIASNGTMNAAYNANLTGGNGGLYFAGPNAVAAYGALVPLFTPGSWQPGASLSHVADSADLMSPNRKLGVRYSLSAVDLGILKDLGYTVAP